MQKEAEQQPPTSSLSSKNQIHKTNPQAQTISGATTGNVNRFISGTADTTNTTVRLRTAGGGQKPLVFGNQASYTNKSSYNMNDVKRRSSYAVANSFRPSQQQTPRSLFNNPNVSPGAFYSSDYQQNGHSQSAIQTRSTSNERAQQQVSTPSAFSPLNKAKLGSHGGLNYSSSFHQNNFYH